VPGPASYGRGGKLPTVTDADLVAGRIPAAAAFPGLGQLDVDAARDALARAGIDATDVLAVVDIAMEEAVRVVTVAQGVDPRGLALVAFGGAGPLHACAVAGALDMRAVVVPPRAGVFSAVGLVASPVQREVVRSWSDPRVHTGLDEALDDLAAAAAALVDRNGASGETTVETALDCRYAGQSHELRVAVVDAFHAEHARRNGFARDDEPVEVVALRARATRRAPMNVDHLPVVERDGARGPAVIAEADCTVFVPAGWEATPGPLGALVLRPDRDRT